MFEDKQLIADARQHAADEYPKESCGVVVGGKYCRCANVSATPETDFEVDSKDLIKYHPDIQAIVHSHPTGPNHPSEADQAGQQEGDIPWLILPGQGKPFWFGDQVPIAPLLGREFKWAVHDCYTLVRDYYRLEYGIVLINKPKPDGWGDKNTTDDLLTANFNEAGFRQLNEDEELQVGDVLLGSIMSTINNHLWIYTGNSQVMHHMVGRLSVYDNLNTWRKYYSMRLRYKKW